MSFGVSQCQWWLGFEWAEGSDSQAGCILTSNRVRAPRSVPYSMESSPELPAPVLYMYFGLLAAAAILFRFSYALLVLLLINELVGSILAPSTNDDYLYCIN